MLYTLSRTHSIDSVICNLLSANALISDWGKILMFINRFPNKPWFLRVFSTSLFENTVGKGEIACHEQFLLFPQCFLPICHFHQFSAIFIKCPWARHFRAQPSIGETQENMNNVSCRLESGVKHHSNKQTNLN